MANVWFLPTFALAFALALSVSACSREEARALAPAPGNEPKPARVLLATELGEIEIEIDSGRAPVTAANFLKYVDAGRFDGGRFHRTVKPDNQPDSAVKIEVIQGGINPAREGEKLEPIALERTNT